jgi:putative oxidoreductase
MIKYMMCKEKGCVAKQYGPRVFLSLLFVVGGFGFLLNFKDMVGFVGTGLGNIGLPMSIATVALIIAIILKLGGGLMLMFNYRRSQAAWMLIAFTALATLMYHTSWGGDDGQMQMTSFLKNLAIIGGLMFFAHCPCKQCQKGCQKNTTSCCKENGKKNSGSCCQSGSHTETE